MRTASSAMRGILLTPCWQVVRTCLTQGSHMVGTKWVQSWHRLHRISQWTQHQHRDVPSDAAHSLGCILAAQRMWLVGTTLRTFCVQLVRCFLMPTCGHRPGCSVTDAITPDQSGDHADQRSLAGRHQPHGSQVHKLGSRSCIAHGDGHERRD